MEKYANKLQLQVEYIDINLLTPYEKNAKEHPQEQVDQIMDSIQRYGMNDPIGVYGQNNLVIEGHGRLLACKGLGFETVPVIHLDHLSEAQRREYTLIHNQTTMNSGFNLQILQQELEELEEMDIDFDASDFGFDIYFDAEEEADSTPKNAKRRISEARLGFML